jgi:hypothetical protein
VAVSSNETIAACSSYNSSRNVGGDEMMDGVGSSGSRMWQSRG